MSNSWEKVRSFLDTMDIPDFRSPLPSSFSSSSSSNCDIHPLTIDTKSWKVGDQIAQQILSVIQPNAESENRRKEITEYLQRLIEDFLGIKVFSFGSVPLKTYLPHGDIDLTAVSDSSTGHDLASDICYLLENEEKNNPIVQVKDVSSVPAQVRVVKCTVGGISVDISFNQIAGLSAFYFLDQVDRFIGMDHFFKRSVILIKAWCYYESRLLGGFHGLISTYALEIMVLHVINLFHSSLHSPLAVLYKFLEYYSTFDWNRYCIDINGLVLISSLPNILVQRPPDCDDLLLTDAFLRNSREAILSSMGAVGSKNSAFNVKFINILDPLREDNNLGRCVNKGNFYRIRSALSYGAQKLQDILTLPIQNIRNGLEKFFKDTLERNGKGWREDVEVPVPAYGSKSTGNSGSDHLLSGIHYCMWFHDYGAMYPPVLPETPPSHRVWNDQWAEMGHNLQFDQNLYNNINRSPPSAVNGPRSIPHTNAAFVKEKRKSRGTGTYIPNFEYIMRRSIILEATEVEHECGKELECGKDQETEKEIEIVDSSTCTPGEVNLSDEGGNIEGNIEAFNFSIEEFPVLPGSKPKLIKLTQVDSPKPEQVEETSVSLDSLEFDSLKHSSPRCQLLSEAGKLSDSDVSAIQDLVSDPTTVTVLEDQESSKIEAVLEDQESSKIEEILVVPEKPLQLADDMEFPPLSRPPEPVIMLNKKEFPPLRSCLKPHKKTKWKKDLK